MVQLVKNLPAMPETWVQSLGWDDPLEKGKATHSSILAWRIPWTGITLSNFLFSLASESTPNFLSKYSLGAYYIVSSILDGFTTI